MSKFKKYINPTKLAERSQTGAMQNDVMMKHNH